MKEENKHSIDGLYSEKLKDFQKEPPAEVWDNIYHALQGKRKRRRLVLFTRIAAGIALLFALGITYRYVIRDGGDQTKRHIVTSEQNFAEPARRPPAADWQTLPGRERKKDKIYPPGHDLNAGREPSIVSTNISSGKKSPSPAVARAKTGSVPEKDQRDGSLLEQEKTIPARVQDTLTGYPLAANIRPHLPEIISRPGDDSLLLPSRRPEPPSWESLLANDAIGEEPVQPSRKLFLSAAVSPVYSYRSIESAPEVSEEWLNQSEKATISYSGQVNIGYTASKRLAIRTGLVYSRIGVEISSIEAFGKKTIRNYSTYNDISKNADFIVVACSIGTVDPSAGNETIYSNNESPPETGPENDNLNAPGGNLQGNEIYYKVDRITMDQWFHFIEVPFMLSYKVLDRGIGLNLMGGLSTNFLLAGDIILNEAGSKSYYGTVRDLRKVNYSGNFGIGLEADLSEHVLFTVEPQMKYYLNSINGDNFITSRPYYIGLYTGIRYRF